MITCNVWEEGVSWEDRCRCIQVQKDELAKKAHALEDALRQARTRCEHLETLVKQAARRHLIGQQNQNQLEYKYIDDDLLAANCPLDPDPSGDHGNIYVPSSKHKYNRDEQDFIQDLKKRNSILQHDSDKVHQRLKSAIQLIKKYKKDVKTLRLRADAAKNRHTHSCQGGRKGESACQKSVDFYHDMESDTDDGLNQEKMIPKISSVDATNILELNIKAQADHDRVR